MPGEEVDDDDPQAGLRRDAALVVEYASRAGRLFPDLVQALTALRAAGAAADPALVDRLHISLSAAIAQIAPVTLLDLRAGWNPFVERPGGKLGRALFGACGIVLFMVTVWCTALYNKANSVLTALHSIQDARPTEQVARVFRAARLNEQELGEALAGSGKDILYESFTRSVADLQQLNDRIQAFVPQAYDVKGALDSPLRALLRLMAAPGDMGGEPMPGGGTPSPTWQRDIAEWQQSYGTARSEVVVPSPSGQPGIEAKIDDQYRSIAKFNEIIGIQIHPQAFPAFTKLISDIEDGRALLGGWVIPGLYGMLGAVVFHMRRILDPLVPDPSLARLTYRICLGGLAGVVIAWFWTPGSGRPGDVGAVSFSAFSVAFLVGYSIDIFFQMLDRLVDSAASAVGKARPGA